MYVYAAARLRFASFLQNDEPPFDPRLFRLTINRWVKRGSLWITSMDHTPLFVFPKWSNPVVVGLIVCLLILPFYAAAFIGYALDPVTLNANYQPRQPIAYSHALHVGQLGIDCRYCHNTVEKAGFAAVPPTESCMNCHKAIRPNSDKLQALRNSYGTGGGDPARVGGPILWERVHMLPDYVSFNHAAHVNAAVSCVECHSKVNRMEVVYQAEPLNMAWCLQCHRAPESKLRPRDQVTDLEWKPETARVELGKKLKKLYHVNPVTDCVTCHR